jgi:hypothetical protein
VHVAARNEQKAEVAHEDLKIQTGKTAIYLNLDLADLKSVRAAADEFMSKEQQYMRCFTMRAYNCRGLYLILNFTSFEAA